MKFHKHTFLLLIIICSSTFSGALSLESNTQSLKLYILSKQVRLLKEQKLKQIIIKLPAGVAVEDCLAGEYLNDKKLKLVYYNQKWILKTSHKIYEDKFHIKLSGVNADKCVSVEFKNEKRFYPPQFEIIKRNRKPAFYVTENIKQYAVDSAIAEYGIRSKSELEAVKALAQLIYARTYYQKKNYPEKKYLFSDLTDSQVYRGRFGFDVYKYFPGEWYIDWKKLKEQLYFHASCGGETYDSSIFGKTKFKSFKRKDYLYRSGESLCRTSSQYWQKFITQNELKDIFNYNKELNTPLLLKKNNSKKKILIRHDQEVHSYSFETFRLMINRRKGWNFLKSNNYNIQKIDQTGYTFKGTGLGHGVGLCQQGALKLSRLGYNSFEILEHYFPDLELNSIEQNIYTSPYLSYCVFDYRSGTIVNKSNIAIERRKFPAGSFWKVVIALYLGKERPDIFKSHTYNCRGYAKKNKNMPFRCWTNKGHGELKIKTALSNSCNLYFASLYSKIEYRRFENFFNQMAAELSLDITLPEMKNKKDWAYYLSGLDFRFSLTVENLIKIFSLVSPDEVYRKNILQYRRKIPEFARMQIYEALADIFISGTASGKIKKYGSGYNYFQLLKRDRLHVNNSNPYELWGKTSTVIDGTNKPINYGMFIGGYEEKGIIVFLRKGNGHLAAKWASKLIESNFNY